MKSIDICYTRIAALTKQIAAIQKSIEERVYKKQTLQL